MIATMKTANAEGIRRQDRDRQEKNGLARGYKAITVQGGKVKELVDVRIAFGSSGTAYACVWACGKETWNSGSGRASGGGYHKASAAVGEAISRAGFTLSEPISGRGNNAIEEAVKAVGECLVTDGSPVYVIEMYA